MTRSKPLLIVNTSLIPMKSEIMHQGYDILIENETISSLRPTGEIIAEFGDSLIYTPEKERIDRTIPKGEEGLIFKDVNLFKLRSERKKWELLANTEMAFIQSTR